MKTILSGVAIAALIALALPAWAQQAGGGSSGTTTQGQSMEQHAPGTGGASKPGVQGLPGSKSGKTMTPSGTTSGSGSSESQSGMTKMQDQSQVPGAPGNKSGAATGQGRQDGSGSSTNR